MRLMSVLTSSLALLVALANPARATPIESLVDQALKYSDIAFGVNKASKAPVPLPKGGDFTQCANLFPNRTPLDVVKVNPQWKPMALCSNHFAVLYSATSKTPLVVVERLTREQLLEAKDEERTNEFFADPRLSRRDRSELDDYKGSGYDRGHASPAASAPDQTSMAQSFALSNMVPQDPTHNRKVWSKVESDVRKYVRRATGNVYVFTGPVFQGQLRTIGRNQVWVPSHMFKLVFDEASKRSWAYVLPNTSTAQITQPMDYASFVAQTGWALLPK
jgi:endonuclease G